MLWNLLAPAGFAGAVEFAGAGVTPVNPVNAIRLDDWFLCVSFAAS